MWMLLGILGVVLFGIFVLYFNHRLAPSSSFTLKGRHALVTGGSSGIGKEVARILLRRGCAVTLMARTESVLQAACTELKKELGEGGPPVFVACADVCNAKQVLDAIDRAAHTAGQPFDVVVCSAGVTSVRSFEETSIEKFAQVIQTNQMGIIHVLKGVLPGMKQRREGRVSLVASQLSHLGIHGSSGYAPTKFAVRGLAECLYQEYRPYNVYFSVSYPPDTDTPMYEEEMKEKDPVLRKISEDSSVVWSPVPIAQGIVDGLETWKFSIYYGMEGMLMDTTCSSFHPQTSFLQLLVFPFLRIIGMAFVLIFDRAVKSCMTPNKKKVE